jgi:hypothetical protein
MMNTVTCQAGEISCICETVAFWNLASGDCFMVEKFQAVFVIVWGRYEECP